MDADTTGKKSGKIIPAAIIMIPGLPLVNMMSRRKCEIMNIVKKEIIIFNKEEREAINLLLKICNEIRGATSDSNLEKLAKETYNNVATLVGYEDDEEEEEDKE